MSKVYYIYAMQDPFDRGYRYIGMTTRLEVRFRNHCKSPCNEKMKIWIGNLEKQNEKPIMVILDKVKGEKVKALDKEKETIRYYSGIYSLCNEYVTCGDTIPILALNNPTPKDLFRMNAIGKHADKKTNSDKLRKALEYAELYLKSLTEK